MDENLSEKWDKIQLANVLQRTPEGIDYISSPVGWLVWYEHALS